MDIKTNEILFPSTIKKPGNTFNRLHSPKSLKSERNVEFIDPRYIPLNKTIEEQAKVRQAYISLLNDANNSRIRASKGFTVVIPSISSSNSKNQKKKNSHHNQAIIDTKVHISTIVPHSSSSLLSLRKVYISKPQYQHLMDEINGGKYGPPERPDIETFLVGFGCKVPHDRDTIDKTGTHIVHDETNGEGLEVCYEVSKKIFILSKYLEDKLILLAYNDLEKSMELNRCVTKFGVYEIDYVDSSRQDQWQSFIKQEIEPLLHDSIRIKKLIDRVVKNRVKTVYAKLQHMESDSNSYSSDEDKDSQDDENGEDNNNYDDEVCESILLRTNRMNR